MRVVNHETFTEKIRQSGPPIWMHVDCETVVHSDGKCSNHVYEFHLALRLGHSGAALGKGAWVIRLCVCKLDTTDRMLARAAGTMLGELV